MRDAITLRNTHNTHLKPSYTKDMPVHACTEHAHARERQAQDLALASLALGAPMRLQQSHHKTQPRQPGTRPRARFARARGSHAACATRGRSRALAIRQHCAHCSLQRSLHYATTLVQLAKRSATPPASPPASAPWLRCALSYLQSSVTLLRFHRWRGVRLSRPPRHP